MASVCVVGAGVGGLAVAARLAAKKHDVVVFEACEVVGGQLRSRTQDGFTFDLGPSHLTLPAVYRDLFLKTGRPLEDELELLELEPGFNYHFDDSSDLALPGGSAGRVAAAIASQLGPKAGDEWREFTRNAGERWQRIRESSLTQPIAGRDQVTASLGPTVSGRGGTRRTSLYSESKALFTDRRLRQITNSYAGLVGTDPRAASANLLTWPFVEQAFGLWEIQGGMSMLASAIRTRCESVGVRIELNTSVQAIATDRSGVSGVRLPDGTLHSADIVVSDIDAATLYTRLINDDRSPRVARSSRILTPSGAKFSVQLGVEADEKEPGRHHVWFPDRPGREFRDLRRGQPASDPTIRVTQYDAPTMAPTGQQGWRLQVSAPRCGRGRAEYEWSAEAARSYAQHLLDVLARRGLDLRGRITSQSTCSPADYASELRSPGGSLDGAAMQGQYWALNRPGNISPIPGLYLVGGTTHPGPGLPYAGLSAETVAEHIGRADR